MTVQDRATGTVSTRWYAEGAEAVAQELGVSVERGLSAEEARSRLESHGANRLAGTKKESGFRAFLRQYEDFMQIVLLAAAAINLAVTQDVGTSLVLAGLTVFNAVVGLRQESKAEESVKALAQMMKTVARVRRDGQALETGGSAWPRRWRSRRPRSAVRASRSGRASRRCPATTYRSATAPAWPT